jgi:chaperonin cofactor prefoldin
LVAAQREVRTFEQRIEVAQGELRQLDEKKEVSAEELSAIQTQMCGFRETLSEMDVAIRQLMGTQQASDSVQRCPLNRTSN